MPSTVDLAQIRFNNAQTLFDEFVNNTIKHPDAATLRGLEGRFAERVQLAPSYWSQIKSRSRQIGERLARQFERQCHKPNGWMDQPHFALSSSSVAVMAQSQTQDSTAPINDDERFIVGLVLTYYRRHPQRARTRLLDLLGEVLTPQTGLADKAIASANQATLQAATKSPPVALPTSPPQKSTPAKLAPDDGGHALWLRSQVRVAPLRQKK